MKEDGGPLGLSTPYPVDGHKLELVALDNVRTGIKYTVDDTTVSVALFYAIPPAIFELAENPSSWASEPTSSKACWNRTKLCWHKVAQVNGAPPNGEV